MQHTWGLCHAPIRTGAHESRDWWHEGGLPPQSPTLAENPSEDMHSPLLCGPRFLLQYHSLPWLLSWSDRFSFSNFPSPHGLHITRQGREVDRLNITIHKCFAGKWINEATRKFWRSFRYLTLRPALGLYPPPTWLEALTQPSSRGGWSDDSLPKTEHKKRCDAGQSREWREWNSLNVPKKEGRRKETEREPKGERWLSCPCLLRVHIIRPVWMLIPSLGAS